MQYTPFAQVGFIPLLNHCWYMMAVVHVLHHAALGDRYKQAGTKSIDEADHVMSYLPVCSFNICLTHILLRPP